MTHRDDGKRDFPEIAAFSTNEPIMIEMAPNGGWTVSQCSASGVIVPKTLGAYSSADDMLNALSNALIVRARNGGKE
jgi:hypothetical protein